jgi:SH3-like domain-containing protein
MFRPSLCGAVLFLCVTFPALAEGPDTDARPAPRPAELMAVSTVTETGPAPAAPMLGPETNLPLPRFVSLKSAEANARRGPSLSHRIDWVFVREDMPLQIVAEFGHWRRVIDRDGMGGWVHYSLLSGSRTVIIDQDLEPLYADASLDSRQVALLEAGVIARVEECTPGWCRLSAGGYRGWAPKTAFWGVAEGEVLD